MSYVVYSEPQYGERPLEKPYKFFSYRLDAIQFAGLEVRGDAFTAYVYEVPYDDAREAIEAVRRGESVELVDVKTKKSAPDVVRLEYRNEVGPRKSHDKMGLHRLTERIGQQWLQAVALERGWFELPAKQRVARKYDPFKSKKFSTFGEALDAFLVSSTPAHNFTFKDANGEPGPFELQQGDTVAQAIRREAERQIAQRGKPKIILGDGSDVEF